MSPGAPVPHAHQSVMIQGCRQAAQGPAAPPAPTPVAPAAGAHQRAIEQIPLDISPLSSPLSKGRRHGQRAKSFALRHPHKSPAHSALGKAVFQPPILPSTATFPSSNTSQGSNIPSTARAHVPVPEKKRCLVGDGGRKALGRASSRPPAWCRSRCGREEQNCGVGERVLG